MNPQSIFEQVAIHSAPDWVAMRVNDLDDEWARGRSSRGERFTKFDTSRTTRLLGFYLAASKEYADAITGGV